MEKNKTDCTTLPDSEKCYTTEETTSSYGKSYQDQLNEQKGPSQEEFSNQRYGDKTEADYSSDPIVENPMDQAGDVNTYQAGFARNEAAVDFYNTDGKAMGNKEITEDED